MEGYTTHVLIALLAREVALPAGLSYEGIRAELDSRESARVAREAEEEKRVEAEVEKRTRTRVLALRYEAFMAERMRLCREQHSCRNTQLLFVPTAGT